MTFTQLLAVGKKGEKMLIDLNNSEKPIFLQLAELIEDNILKGIYAEESKVPSTTEMSVVLKINPATANKGVNMLVEEGIIYKKRGIGMYVSEGARKLIAQKRKKTFYDSFVQPLLQEAENLGIGKDELCVMIKETEKREK